MFCAAAVLASRCCAGEVASLRVASLPTLTLINNEEMEKINGNNDSDDYEYSSAHRERPHHFAYNAGGD